MKKILFVTLACIWSVVSMYAWDRNILISTKIPRCCLLHRTMEICGLHITVIR